MNCFNHAEKNAIGICKSCGKGLCAECLVALPNGLACKNACEDRVTLINRIIDINQKMVVAANAQVRSSGLFVLILGSLFVGLGLTPFIVGGSKFPLIFAVLGAPFLVFGIMRLVTRSQRFPEIK